MRIGIVGTDLAPLDARVGALEKLCIGWAAQLRSIGCEVILFSVGHRRQTLLGSNGMTIFDDQEDLDRKLLTANLDAVIVNNRPSWRAAGIQSRINIFHNYPDAWMVESSDNMAAQLERSHNLAVSSALAKHVNTVYPTANTGVLYPFIDESFTLANSADSPTNGRSADRKIKVLFPNRTLEKKGLRWLIDSIDSHPDNSVSLTVVRNISPWTTETSEHRGLLNLVASRKYATIREKALSAESLIALYRTHDVVVTPSVREEGLGLIPLEAQALGIPVVTSNIGGLKESVFPPNLTVEIGSTAQLSQAILSTVKSTGLQREIVRRRVLETFSPGESGRRLADEIKKLFNRDSLG